jgi:hypothetical protein
MKYLIASCPEVHLPVACGPNLSGCGAICDRLAAIKTTISYPRIFALPVNIKTADHNGEDWHGRFLCMLWSRNNVEGGSLSGLREPTARDGSK